MDAKAWSPEENLQNIFEQCLAQTAIPTKSALAVTGSLEGSVIADEPVNTSDAHSVAGGSVDNASLASTRSADPIVIQRRQQFQALRQNLMAIMVTMDEKNHVINNANEEVARHIRRLSTLR